MAKLRLGVSDVLSGRPLSWGFLKGHHNDLFETTVLPPARISELLKNGEIDVGLIPSVALATSPGLKVLPDLCVATRPGSEAALLLSSTPELADIRRIAVDRGRTTGPLALQLLFKSHFELDVELVPQDDQVTEIPPGCDGALLGPESALASPRRDAQILNLADAWREFTGLPLVLGVWAAREDCDLPDLAFYFKSSLRYGLSSLAVVSREAGTEKGLRINRVERYYRDQLNFVLASEERQGLWTLLDLCADHGVLPRIPEIRWA